MIKRNLCISCNKNYVFSKKLCVSCYNKQYKPSYNTKPNWIKKQSDKNIEKTKKYQKIRDQYFLNYPQCEFPGCNSIDIECHHKGGRIGDNLYINLMSVCSYHHDYIHNHVEESKQNGWLL
jgi:hypothetical protein